MHIECIEETQTEMEMKMLTTLKIKLARKLVTMIKTDDVELAVSLSKANANLYLADQWLKSKAR